MFQNPANPNLTSFPNPRSLSVWLQSRLPADSLSKWGRIPDTNNIRDLWLELAHGDVSLTEASPPILLSQVVYVRIKGHNNTKILVESCQEFSDGARIKTGRPLSEIMMVGEDIEAAAKRGIKGQLESVIHKVNEGRKDINFDDIVRVVLESCKRRVEQKDSSVYPGLSCCYVIHTVDAFVEGLPNERIVTKKENEYSEIYEGVLASEVVMVKRHIWKWVSVDSC